MLDQQTLDDQLHALGARMCDPSIPRNAQGYQGRVSFSRIVPAVIAVGDDGQEYVMDPTEFASHGDAFFRQYVTLGRRSGGGIGSILAKLLPIIATGPAGDAGGLGIDVLKSIFGKTLLVLCVLAADAAVWSALCRAVG